MNITELNQRLEKTEDSKLKNIYNQFNQYLIELAKKDLPESLAMSVNKDIEIFNSVDGSDKELRKEIKKTQSKVIKLVEKELKIVPKNYYRNLWLAIGMGGFGVMFGVVFGMTLNNMAFLSLGLPIGMAIGIGIGTGMDKKALAEGRQLDVEIKY